MRALRSGEIESIKVLTQNSVELTLIEATKTGLEKSIMDATGPVRTYLKEKSVHDYESQNQGVENKVSIDAVIIDGDKEMRTEASLYRPNTKTGDPRIWFKKLNSSYVEPNDILAIIFFDKKLYIINISKYDIAFFLGKKNQNPIQNLIEEINKDSNRIPDELLYLLRKIAASGPVRADLNADTAVGRTLERLLGIKTNSSKQPDYKGIEIKSFRSEKQNRKNLFAQVPDWGLSNFKSSAKLLEAFGYSREQDYKLYCTVSALRANSQGLILDVNEEKGWLVEQSIKKSIGEVVVWPLEILHKRLSEKHNETFWISAKSTEQEGHEYFTYNKVVHTKKPINSQFDILLNQGIITVDHLIKRTSDGRVIEKGPLFKIKPKAISLLFPPSVSYDLL